VRVRWEARPQQADLGTFKLTFNSAVSGRELAVVADQRGPGRGEFYIPEEPRPAYFIVESENLEWSFSADEGIAGTLRSHSQPPTPNSQSPGSSQ
jgi:hypothetical protein